MADRIELEPPALLEIPRSQEHGDLSTNVAMQLAKPLRNAPRKIAEELLGKLELDSSLISKVEIAGPGFINFTYSPEYLRMLADSIIEAGNRYGSSDLGNGKRVNLEFVSANPTGPLNIVSARAAALGDSLKRIMNFSGYEAKSEFYVNDAGQQKFKLIHSFLVRYAQRIGESDIPFPDDGYHGQYLIDLAESFEPPDDSVWDEALKMVFDHLREIAGKPLQGLHGYIYEKIEPLTREFSIDKILELQKNTLTSFKVLFDKWVRESEIREQSDPDKLKDRFIENGLAYEKDNATYFKTSAFGDDEDRVIWTSDGRPTYFLPDIAYHQDKHDRGFEWLIDIWGPDHHGYIARMKAALRALGHPEDSFTVIIAQQVNLMRGGEKVKMSKRAGEIIEMQELIDEVGADAARFFFLQRKATAHLDFDLDLAVKETEENPVFYVQYAHARICSIERVAAEAGITGEPVWDKIEHPSEHNLIRKMSEFPLIVEICAKNLEPQRITVYLGELASYFHSFYQQCRVVTDDAELSAARLGLCRAVRQVLKTGLGLLGVSAPVKM